MNEERVNKKTLSNAQGYVITFASTFHVPTQRHPPIIALAIDLLGWYCGEHILYCKNYAISKYHHFTCL